MFIFAELYMKYLSDQDTPDDLERESRCDRVPEGLDELYANLDVPWMYCVSLSYSI